MEEKDWSQILADFSATKEAKPNLTEAEWLQKFPEFGNNRDMLQAAFDYDATVKSGKYKDPMELQSKFPEFWPARVDVSDVEAAQQPQAPAIESPENGTEQAGIPTVTMEQLDNAGHYQPRTGGEPLKTPEQMESEVRKTVENAKMAENAVKYDVPEDLNAENFNAVQDRLGKLNQEQKALEKEFAMHKLGAYDAVKPQGWEEKYNEYETRLKEIREEKEALKEYSTLFGQTKDGKAYFDAQKTAVDEVKAEQRQMSRDYHEQRLQKQREREDEMGFFGRLGKALQTAENPITAEVVDAITDPKENDLRNARNEIRNAEQQLRREEMRQNGEYKGLAFLRGLNTANYYEMIPAIGMADAMSSLDLAQALAEGRELTDSQKLLLKAQEVRAGVDHAYQDNNTMWERLGMTAPEQLVFTAQFVVGAGITNATKIGERVAAKGAQRAAIRWGERSISGARQLIGGKIVPKLEGMVVSSTIQTFGNPLSVASMVEDFEKRYAGGVYYDENGQLHIYDNNKSAQRAMYQAIASAWIENFTEYSGQNITKAKLKLAKQLDKTFAGGEISGLLNSFDKKMKQVGASKIYDVLRIPKTIGRATQIGDNFEENDEELLGNVMTAFAGTEWENGQTYGEQLRESLSRSFSGENLLETFLSCSIMSFAMGGGGNAANRVATRQERKEINRIVEETRALLGRVNGVNIDEFDNIIENGEVKDIAAYLKQLSDENVWSEKEQVTTYNYLMNRISQMQLRLNDDSAIAAAQEQLRKDAEAMRNLTDDNIYNATWKDRDGNEQQVQIVNGKVKYTVNEDGTYSFNPHLSSAMFAVRLADGSIKQVPSRTIQSLQSVMSVDEQIQSQGGTIREMMEKQFADEGMAIPTIETVWGGNLQPGVTQLYDGKYTYMGKDENGLHVFMNNDKKTQKDVPLVSMTERQLVEYGLSLNIQMADQQAQQAAAVGDQETEAAANEQAQDAQDDLDFMQHLDQLTAEATEKDEWEVLKSYAKQKVQLDENGEIVPDDSNKQAAAAYLLAVSEGSFENAIASVDESIAALSSQVQQQSQAADISEDAAFNAETHANMEGIDSQAAGKIDFYTDVRGILLEMQAGQNEAREEAMSEMPVSQMEKDDIFPVEMDGQRYWAQLDGHTVDGPVVSLYDNERAEGEPVDAAIDDMTDEQWEALRVNPQAPSQEVEQTSPAPISEGEQQPQEEISGKDGNISPVSPESPVEETPVQPAPVEEKTQLEKDTETIMSRPNGAKLLDNKIKASEKSLADAQQALGDATTAYENAKKANEEGSSASDEEMFDQETKALQEAEDAAREALDNAVAGMQSAQAEVDRWNAVRDAIEGNKSETPPAPTQEGEVPEQHVDEAPVEETPPPAAPTQEGEETSPNPSLEEGKEQPVEETPVEETPAEETPTEEVVTPPGPLSEGEQPTEQAPEQPAEQAPQQPTEQPVQPKKEKKESEFQKRITAVGEPRTLEEAILYDIAVGGAKFRWGNRNEDKAVVKRGIGDLWKYSNSEYKKRIGIVKKDGYSIETYAEAILAGQLQPYSGAVSQIAERMDMHDIIGTIEDVLQMVTSRSGALQAIEEKRLAEAEEEENYIRSLKDAYAQERGFKDFDEMEEYYTERVGEGKDLTDDEYYEISRIFAEQYGDSVIDKEDGQESREGLDRPADSETGTNEQSGVRGEGEGGNSLLQSQQTPSDEGREQPGQETGGLQGNPHDGTAQEPSGAAEVRDEIGKLKAKRADIIRQRDDIQQRYEKANGLFGDTQADESDLFGGQNFLSPELAQATIDGYNRQIRQIDDRIAKLEASLKRAGEVKQTEIGTPAMESPENRTEQEEQKPIETREELDKRLMEERKQRILTEGTSFDKPFGLVPVSETMTVEDIDTNMQRIAEGLKANEGNKDFGNFYGFAYQGNFKENAGQQVHQYFYSLGGVVPNETLNAWAEKHGIKSKEDVVEYGKKLYDETNRTDKTDKETEEEPKKETKKQANTPSKAGPAKIDDVGEKIGGARKDLAQQMSGKIKLDADTFPKMFPKFDLKKLVEQGLDPKMAAAVMFLRQAAYAEYKQKNKRQGKDRALAAAKFFAAYAKQVLEKGDTDVEFTDSGWVFTDYGKIHMKANIALYGKIHDKMGNDMFDVDLTGYEILPVNVDSKSTYTAYRKNEKGENVPFKPRYVTRTKSRTSYFKEDELDQAIDEVVGMVEQGVSYDKSHPYKLGVYYTRGKDNSFYVGVKIGNEVKALTEPGSLDATRAYLNEHEAELQAEAARVEQQTKEDKKKERPVAKVEIIKSDRSQGALYGYVFAVKIGKEYVNIMDDTFDLRTIYKYEKEHHDELQEKAQQMLDQYLEEKESGKGWKPQLNLGGGRARVGEDYRNGRDIGADEFRDTFGFRGVEFGNYVTQKERQRYLNEAYDAFMDLADLLGVSPRALSLGGQLGFAIGARGGGGKNAAHYEPELNVINLTKTQGAGSVAHEWWHALDFYFNQRNGERKRPATGNTVAESFDASVRREMAEAFVGLMEKVNDSEYFRRSKRLDNKTNRQYFATDTELGARAFQDYVQRRLTERGQVNDFLSSFTPEEQWNGEETTYPYPTGEEANAIDERFDKLFSTMEEREDENGNTILFSVTSQTEALAHQYQQKLDEIDRRMAEADNSFVRNALRAARAGYIKEYLERIKDAGREVVVYNNDNLVPMLKSLNVHEADIRYVEHQMASGRTIEGFYLGNAVYINADAMTDIDLTRSKFVHERQHAITRQKENSVYLQAVLQNATRKELQEAVDKMSGARGAYNSKPNDILADEFISFAMERAYSAQTDAELEEALGAFGINRDLIEIIKLINNEQRNNERLSKARRPVSVDRRSDAGGNRQDERNPRKRPEGDLGRQGVGTAGQGAGGTEGRQSVAQTPRNSSINDVLYSITVNHNSPHLIKKADGTFVDPETGERLGFDHRFMSTGEGIQAHGWGSYFSVEDLRHYADDLNNPNTPPMRAAMRQQGRRWLEENPTFEAWKETKEFKDYYYNHEDSAFKYIEELKTRGPEWQADIEDIEKRIEERRRQREDEDYLRKQYGIEREAALTQSSRHHYDVEIPDDNGTNYFEENEPMKPEQIAMLQAQSDKEGAKAEVGGFLFYANPAKNPYADRYTFRKFLTDITSDMGGGLNAQQASEFFHRAGFTGIHYYGSRDGEGYVIFDEDDARIVDHVRFSVTNNNQEIFVSNAARAVEAIKQEKATPEQWLAMLKKNGGLKEAEDKWLGLSQWLKDSEAKTLTKQEVLDFINENMVQVEEVEYGSSLFSINSKQNLESDIARAKEEGESVESVLQLWDKMFGMGLVEAYQNGEFTIDENGRVNIDQKMLQPINSTRLQYTTQGLQDKREIALTVPTIEPWNKGDEIHFGDAGEGRAVAWVRFGETTDADSNRVLVIDEIQSKRHQEGREKGYKKGTKEDVRKANEATVDAQIHYDTYISDLAEKYNCDRADVYAHATDAEIEEAEARMNAVSSTMREYERIYEEANGIPQAPFEKNWMELAMKRMLRLAAEEGYDKVAWTKGEQQASRYDLTKVIDSIECNHVGKNGRKMFALNGLDYNLVVDTDGTIVAGEDAFVGKPLTDIVGKPLAEKMIGMEEGDVVEGDGLRIGGEGMKGFYDKMIPSFMNKYGKQWGVKVGEVTLPNVEEAGRTMWAVDVTDAMKESVMQGQPMFSINKGANETNTKAKEIAYNAVREALANAGIEVVEATDEDVKRLKDSRKQLKDSKGTIRGWVGNDGKIHLTKDGLNAETPIHEYTHLWAEALQMNNPDLWEQIKGLLKDTPEWKRITSMKEYSNLKDDDRIAGEVLAHISGKKNAERMEAEAKRMIDEAPTLEEAAKAANLLGRMRDALKKFWTWVGKTLLGKKGNINIDQVSNMVLADLTNGVDPFNPRGGKRTNRTKRTDASVEGEMERIKREAQANGTFMKAPNGKPTKLTERQWLQVRTEAFKKWFGDWELAARAKSIRGLKAEEVKRNNYTRDEVKEKYNQLGTATNSSDGRAVTFYHGVFGKMYKEGGLFAQVVPQLKKLFENSLFAYSESDNLAGTTRPDGTIHKERRNVTGYDNYVAKVTIDGKEYYVRFTVMNESDGKRGLHSSMVTNVELYEETANVASTSTTTGGRLDIDGVVDAKLQQFFESATEAEKNSSKIVDENGEPMVVYHGGKGEITVFDKNRIGENLDYGTMGSGFYFTSDRENAENYARNAKGEEEPTVVEVFLNIRNAKDVNWNELDGESQKKSVAFTDKAIAKGHDGFTAIAPNKAQWIVAFNPNQIKSATENNGEFDAGNPDIRFSIDAPESSRMAVRDEFDEISGAHPAEKAKTIRQKYEQLLTDQVNKFRPLKQLEAILSEKKGRKLRDSESFYSRATMTAARTLPQMEAEREIYLLPLEQAVNEVFGILDPDGKRAGRRTRQEEGGRENETMKQLRQRMADYLIAKHGLERNEWFHQQALAKDPNAQEEDKSGLRGLAESLGENPDDYKAVAERVVAEFEQEVGQQGIDNLWKELNGFTNRLLEMSYNDGFTDKDHYEELKGRWKHYVPLRGFAEGTSDDMYYYTTQGGDSAVTMMKAKGRTSKADDPLTHLVRMQEKAVTAGNDNWAKTALYNAAINLPSDLLRVKQVWYTEDPNTGEIIEHYADLSGLTSPDDIDAAIKQFNADMKAAGAKRRLNKADVGKRIRPQNLGEHEIEVWVNGKKFVIEVNGNPSLVRAYSESQDELKGFIKGVQKANRLEARLFTTWNPEFAVKNMMRDTNFALFSAFVIGGTKQWNETRKNIHTARLVLPKLMKDGTVSQTLVKDAADRQKLEQWYREFIENGGETGFTRTMNAEQVSRDINDTLRAMAKGNEDGVTKMEKLAGAIEDLNRWAENSTRFAAYITARERGESVTKAMDAAKNSTLNFNIKGYEGKRLRAWFCFFNARLQGVAQLARLAKQNPKRFAIGLGAAVLTGAMVPFLNILLLGLGGDDDDWKTYEYMSEYTGNNNLVLFVPGIHKFVAIPYSQELAPFSAIGNIWFREAMGWNRNKSAWQQELEMGLAYLPMEINLSDKEGTWPMLSSTVARSVAPTIMQPIVEYAVNENFMNMPLRKDSKYKSELAAWTQAYENRTSGALIKASKWLNGGGSENRWGKAEVLIDPSFIQHVVEGTAGGVGSFIGNARDLFTEPDWFNHLPFVRKFMFDGDPKKWQGGLDRAYSAYAYDFIDERDRRIDAIRYDNQSTLDYARQMWAEHNSTDKAIYDLAKDYRDNLGKYKVKVDGHWVNMSSFGENPYRYKDNGRDPLPIIGLKGMRQYYNDLRANDAVQELIDEWRGRISEYEMQMVEEIEAVYYRDHIQGKKPISESLRRMVDNARGTMDKETEE